MGEQHMTGCLVQCIRLQIKFSRAGPNFSLTAPWATAPVTTLYLGQTFQAWQCCVKGADARASVPFSGIDDEGSLGTCYLHAGPRFSLTFSLGNCTFDDTAILSKDGALECFGPSVALQKTPLTFTSAYRQAATFTGEVRWPSICTVPAHLLQ